MTERPLEMEVEREIERGIRVREKNKQTPRKERIAKLRAVHVQ